MLTAEQRIAKELGVTPAALSYLSRMVAQGTAPQRGNEVKRLVDGGFVACTNSRYSNYESRPYIITDAGRELVRKAREMGW